MIYLFKYTFWKKYAKTKDDALFHAIGTVRLATPS